MGGDLFRFGVVVIGCFVLILVEEVFVEDIFSTVKERGDSWCCLKGVRIIWSEEGCFYLIKDCFSKYENNTKRSNNNHLIVVQRSGVDEKISGGCRSIKGLKRGTKQARLLPTLLPIILNDLC